MPDDDMMVVMPPGTTAMPPGGTTVTPPGGTPPPDDPVVLMPSTEATLVTITAGTGVGDGGVYRANINGQSLIVTIAATRDLATLTGSTGYTAVALLTPDSDGVAPITFAAGGSATVKSATSSAMPSGGMQSTGIGGDANIGAYVEGDVVLGYAGISTGPDAHTFTAGPDYSGTPTGAMTYTGLAFTKRSGHRGGTSEMTLEVDFSRAGMELVRFATGLALIGRVTAANLPIDTTTGAFDGGATFTAGTGAAPIPIISAAAAGTGKIYGQLHGAAGVAGVTGVYHNEGNVTAGTLVLGGFAGAPDAP